jgi:hypothetical protein
VPIFLRPAGVGLLRARREAQAPLARDRCGRRRCGRVGGWVRAWELAGSHLYDPVPTLRAVAARLERLPLEPFPVLPPPGRIALATWTDRKHPNHARRNAAYCRRWGYACVWNATRTLPHLSPMFEKLPLVRWALEAHDAVLMIDDDASVHRQHQPLEDFLRTFPTSAFVASSCGWNVPVSVHAYKTTWDVPSTVHPQRPAGVRPGTYELQSGLILWRRSRYTRTLLDELLRDDCRHCDAYNRETCPEQVMLQAATQTSWMRHVGLLPMHAFQCFPGDLNTYGQCADPFVLHLAGKKAKDSLNRSGLLPRA